MVPLFKFNLIILPMQIRKSEKSENLKLLNKNFQENNLI